MLPFRYSLHAVLVLTICSSIGMVGCSMWHDDTGTLGVGLIAHYPLDGHARDVSGNQRHGVGHSTTATADRFGNSGRATWFDGTRSYVSVTNYQPAEYTGVLSVSVWSRGLACDACGGSLSGLVGMGSVAPFGLAIDDGDRLFFRVVTGGEWTNLLADDVAIDDTQWHHYAAVFAPGEFVRLYLDGSLVAEETVGIPWVIDESPLDLWIGTRAHSRNELVPFFYFSGAMDDVRLYDRVLWPDEVDLLAADR